MDKLFTFFILTLALSGVLFLSGVTTGNPLSAIGIINDVIENGLLGASIYTQIFVTIFGLLLVAAGANAVTFGNSSAALTIASASFTTYLVSLLADFTYLITYAKNKCILDATGTCSEPWYYIIWFIGIILIGGYIYSAADYVLNGD